jgi:hypothetical protein
MRRDSGSFEKDDIGLVPVGRLDGERHGRGRS